MISERPRLRTLILRHRLCPGVLYDTPSGLCARAIRPGERWDGRYGALPGEDRPIWLSGGVRTQLRKMLEEGVFTTDAEPSAVNRTSPDARLASPAADPSGTAPAAAATSGPASGPAPGGAA
jgi:hypothetical protein